MQKNMIAVICWLAAFTALGQNSIRGKVEDSTTKQALAGATVSIPTEGKTTITNDQGFFLIESSTQGLVEIEIRFMGYKLRSLKVEAPISNVIISLNEEIRMTDEVVVTATRAGEKAPTTYTNIDRKDLAAQNFGQDLPFLLNWTPSLVSTSDAGAGVGYTGLRIRGSDATRINVTINGIPYNDSESQGTFWVDIPDIASSTQSIQIQRGVGTSTNGGSAFGASINLQTNTLNADPYAEAIAGVGSYNTQRYTFQTGTGLIKDRWTFEGKVSKILSDGYVERATSDLSSYYLSGGFFGRNTVIKVLTFGGHEITYQAWYGLDEETMKMNRRYNYAGAIYDTLGNVRFYENQVDDYKQDHYQFHISQKLTAHWIANMSLHYTYGRGFYEEYHQGDSLKHLGIPDYMIGNTTIQAMDVVVQKWLDNNFYGSTFSLNYETGKINLILGGALNRYGDAKHFGRVIWAQFAESIPPNYQYYLGKSVKDDLNFYSKLNYNFSSELNAFVDLQYRYVYYKTSGIKDYQIAYDVRDNFNFFNPKIGISYSFSEGNLAYASYAVAHREPNRTDYLEGDVKPRAETLRNLEIGWRKKTMNFDFGINYYLMNYKDQLVLTGELDNAGYPMRANVGKSFRTGVEISSGFKLTNQVTWNVNATVSVNKNVDYIWQRDTVLLNGNTSIALSPNVILGSQLNWSAFKNFNATLLTKYVGKQYLNNMEDELFTLDSYFINDLRLGYSISSKAFSNFEISLLINNVFDVEYSSNGVDWGIPYYFPQAGRNFMTMISIKF